MHTGIVKFFNDEKGFGFIKEEDTNEEFFVHITWAIDELQEWDRVEFEIKEGKRGPIAADVKVIEPALEEAE